MNLEDIHGFLTQSPTIRLLRAQNAPFILDFIYTQFKLGRRITIPHEELLAALTDYLTEVRRSHPDAPAANAVTYLNEWCRDDVRYLRRYFESNSDAPVYQLTAQTETALRFVEESLEKEAQFVGAESRMLTIVDTLREISIYAADDPDRRIQALRARQDRLQEEIESILMTGKAETFHGAQVRERFHFAVELLRRVLSDFRQLEDQFKAITRELQEREIVHFGPRGRLLEFVLDSESVLRDSDQGKSFYGFVNLILSPDRQEALRKLIAEVDELDEVAESEGGLESLRQMMPALTAEAEQVMKTNQRLSASIRRLLDSRASAERRRVAALISDIRKLAMSVRDDPPQGVFELETRVPVSSPWSREFWSPPAEVLAPNLEEIDFGDDERDEAFEMLARMRRLDWNLMRERIGRLVNRDKAISLPRLLEEHPPDSGAVEVMAWIQIAEDDQHVVNPEETDDIVLPSGESYQGKRIMRIPRVVFRG